MQPGIWGLTDPQNVLSKASNGGLMVTGAKRFVEQIEELSYAVQQGMPAEKAPGSTYRVFRPQVRLGRRCIAGRRRADDRCARRGEPHTQLDRAGWYQCAGAHFASRFALRCRASVARA